MNFGRKKEKNAEIVPIAVDLVDPCPFQPRQVFDEDKLSDLAQSIRENGVLQPLSVRRVGERYQLIMGERRLRASKIAGLSTVPCLVVQADDRQAAIFAVVENLQRHNLNFFEEAAAYARLIEQGGMTQAEVAKKLGKSQPAIANKLRLLKLCDRQKEIILGAGLSERHARALLKIDSTALRDRALSYIVLKKYTVAQTEEFVDSLLAEPTTEKAPERRVIVKDVRLFVNTIQKAIALMQQSGIDASAQKREADAYIEYTVRIPKAQTYKKA